ncbi:hypothetical protein GCM10010515_52380 [Streptomyces fructofermentans]|uniref:Uncharacterized protein n=1 Tax=Streptomyces fructofermentans TaxID=152141 RepID=A0A918U0F1_9ACTN|nr:hypothetical protein GCM10010515_52380 [Streptomyces fructofermentans]
MRDTVVKPPLRSIPYGVVAGEFEEALRRERAGGLQWASTPVERADRGNQPISRRVDTISKQYQGDDIGGGAPWES